MASDYALFHTCQDKPNVVSRFLNIQPRETTLDENDEEVVVRRKKPKKVVNDPRFVKIRLEDDGALLKRLRADPSLWEDRNTFGRPFWYDLKSGQLLSSILKHQDIREAFNKQIFAWDVFEQNVLHVAKTVNMWNQWLHLMVSTSLRASALLINQKDVFDQTPALNLHRIVSMTIKQKRDEIFHKNEAISDPYLSRLAYALGVFAALHPNTQVANELCDLKNLYALFRVAPQQAPREAVYVQKVASMMEGHILKIRPKLEALIDDPSAVMSLPSAVGVSKKRL